MWSRELGKEISKEEWQKIRLNSYHNVISVKLKYFQYRLLNRKLTTNVLHNKWDRNVSPMRTFCGKANETVIHIMFRCVHIVKFWNNWRKWINYIIKCKILITPEIIVCNNITGQFNEFINTSLLIAKQYIYAMKCLKNELSFIKFVQKVHEMYLDELAYAKHYKCTFRILKKWDIYKKQL